MRTLLFLTALLLLGVPSFADGAPYRVEAGKIERKAPGLEVDVAYPKVVGLPEALAQPLNRRLKAEAEEQVRSFVTQAADTRKEAPDMPAEIVFSLTTQVEAKHASPRLVVALVTGYEFTGGAHGIPFFETVAVDALDGRSLEFQDMFRPGTPYLEKISQIAIRMLDARAQEIDTTKDWIREGAGPKAANFQVFWPGDDGLHVQFPNYQVGPYSAGAPEIVIPYASLKGLLNDRYFD